VQLQPTSPKQNRYLEHLGVVGGSSGAKWRRGGVEVLVSG
jgi:hypothetical protein